MYSYDIYLDADYNRNISIREGRTIEQTINSQAYEDKALREKAEKILAEPDSIKEAIRQRQEASKVEKKWYQFN